MAWKPSFRRIPFYTLPFLLPRSRNSSELEGPNTPQWDSGDDSLMTEIPGQVLLSHNLREYHSLLQQIVSPTDGKKQFSKPDIQFTALHQHQTKQIKECLFSNLCLFENTYCNTKYDRCHLVASSLAISFSISPKDYTRR